MTQTQQFTPGKMLHDFRTEKQKHEQNFGDRRDGTVYHYDEDTVLAINVALTLGRPLLIQGPSGSGKSSVAFNLARCLNRRYYEYVVTSKSQARDLLYQFDAIKRLSDAQVLPQLHASMGKLVDEDHLKEHLHTKGYIKPGVLWWVYNPIDARDYGKANAHRDPAKYTPASTQATDSVLLIDEIDKADPDFPNNLLVELGSKTFQVDETGHEVKPEKLSGIVRSPLIIITTNRERRLPDAFLRRCVVHTMHNPDHERLKEIAKTTEPTQLDDDDYDKLIEQIQMIKGEKHRVSIAEFLDAVRAYSTLIVRTDRAGGANDAQQELERIVRIIVDKSSNPT